MTTSDTTQHPGQPAGRDEAGLDRFFDWLRSLDVRRDTDEKWLAGVCSGLATRLGVDPIVVRAGLVLLVLLGGLGITVYLVAWAFIPNESEEILAERAVRQGEVMPIILLVVIGLSLFGGTGFAHDNGGFVWFWWLVLTVGVVVWLVTRHRGGRTTPLTAGHQPATAGYGSSAPTTMAGAGTIPTAPGTTAPGTTAPGTTAPGTTAPGTTAPGT
ncbi:PspC domain-containing protein, partial [Pedococcus sp. 5OH_020]|uniref:PspC domain-containing protein n=1 Tax=Pedococcus sp. 5OH_020 TaxID=2989814 RepID=UPI0022E9B086